MARTGLTLAGVVAAILSIGFLSGWSAVTRWWLWPDYSRLSLVFVASTLAAAAAPLLWIGLRGEAAAVRSGALNFMVAAGGIGLFLATGDVAGARHVGGHAVLFVGAACVAAAVLVMVRRIEPADTVATPPLLRWIFLLLTVVLLGAGFALLSRVPSVFPWRLLGAESVVYGWFFLGSAAYFLDGFLRPGRFNATGQLIGFLAYDLVLLVPFVGHLSRVAPAHRLSLALYLFGIVSSAAMAIYYLFLAPGFRPFGPRHRAG